jgi:hypothetical protein
MISKDVIKANLRDKISAGLSESDPEGIVTALTDFANNIQQGFIDDFKSYQQVPDQQILSRHSVRRLSAQENKFYNSVIKAYRTGDIEKGFEGADNAFPETVIDAVLDDMKTNYPLLNMINIQNTSTVTRMIVNKKGVQLAVWGALGTKIAEELDGAISKVDIKANKLTAFMVISKDMLDAGPEWMDAYIRSVLVEANGGGLCKAIVAGTGNNEPIGMMKDVSDTASVVNGVYQDKAAVAITDLSPKTMGSIAATISTGPNKRTRPVPRLLLVVNPKEYFDKIMPATTLLTAGGVYANNVLPFPTDIIQDSNVPDGKAIFGLASRYFMGVGKGGSGGKIEYSDEVRFLDDERVYITKMYGNGLPLDNNAFVVVDITGLTAVTLEVNVKQVNGVVKTKEQV